MKTCITCKEEKELTDFYKDKRRTNGLKSECKSCNSARAKKWAKNNPEQMKKHFGKWKNNNSEKFKEIKEKSSKMRTKINRAKIAEIHGTTCVHCGATESQGKKKSLELHHPDPNEKDFNVAEKLHYQWQRIEAEVRKCILLCRQCHRAVHNGKITL